MLAPSTVPVAPHPARIKEGSVLQTIVTSVRLQVQGQLSLGNCQSLGRRGDPLRLTLPVGESQSGGISCPLAKYRSRTSRLPALAIILVVAGIVIFWRFALRLMLAIGVVAVGLGLLVLLQSMHR